MNKCQHCRCGRVDELKCPELKLKMVTLKDGTEVPAEDFWLHAPKWVIDKYSEQV